MKFDPPRLMRGPLSNRVYVVTHGKILGHDAEGREQAVASVKYDVTDQFKALIDEYETNPDAFDITPC